MSVGDAKAHEDAFLALLSDHLAGGMKGRGFKLHRDLGTHGFCANSIHKNLVNIEVVAENRLAEEEDSDWDDGLEEALDVFLGDLELDDPCDGMDKAGEAICRELNRLADPFLSRVREIERADAEWDYLVTQACDLPESNVESGFVPLLGYWSDSANPSLLLADFESAWNHLREDYLFATGEDFPVEDKGLDPVLRFLFSEAYGILKGADESGLGGFDNLDIATKLRVLNCAGAVHSQMVGLTEG